MYDTTFSSVVDSLHRDLFLFCRERLEERGLTTGLMYFILYAAKKPGCTPTELGSALGLDKAYVLRCLRRLTEGGWLVRKPHPTDGRASLLYATEKGEEVFRLSHTMLDEWESLRMACLDDSEKEQLMGLLEKIEKEKNGGKRQ